MASSRSSRLPDTVIFDLDGTLVDTAEDLTAALNHCLTSIGRPPVAAAAVRAMVGLGARKLLERGLGASGNENTALIDQLQSLFLEYYAAHLCVHSHIYPGAVALLEQLQAHGVRMGICTNKPSKMSLSLIEHLGLTGFFTANLGADSLDVRKPHPRHLLETIKRVGGIPSSSVMIGDSIVDATTARAAQIPIILVRFGFSVEPVDTLEADAIIDHFDEAWQVLERLASSSQ